MKYEEIYKILEKYELERFYEDNQMIPRYNYPKLINELLEAINYTRCCEALKNKTAMTFEDFLKEKYIYIEFDIYQSRNYHYKKSKKEVMQEYNNLGKYL